MTSLDRRSFLAATCGTALMPTLLKGHHRQKRKRIAFLGTEVRQHSHAQHFLDRLAQGYTWGGKWRKPPVDIASVFIDQFPPRRPRKATYRQTQSATISHYRQSLDVRRIKTCGGRSCDHRRTRQLSHQREGATSLSAVQMV